MKNSESPARFVARTCNAKLAPIEKHKTLTADSGHRDHSNRPIVITGLGGS